MPSNVATAYVQIIPSAQGIGGGIAQALGGDAAATSAGQSIGGKLVSTIKGVIAAAGLGAALGKALTEGAALEQSLGGIETLFGAGGQTIEQYAASVGKSVADVTEKYNSLMRSQETMIANADNAWKTAGVSANKYMKQVTSFSATLLQGLGGDTAAAAQYADKAIVQMSDNANKMGTDISSIQMAYQGFAKDNYTMLDNLKLGYGGTQAEMARLINDSGVLGDSIEVTAETVNDVPFDKIIDAIGVIQDDLGITGTTAQEAATTLSGSFASMQAAAQNVLANLTLGRDLGPALDGLAQTVSTFLVGNLLPAIWNILSALPGALVSFVQSLGAQLVVALQGTFPQLAAGLSAGLPQLMQTGAAMVQNLVQGVTTTLPAMLQAGTQTVTTAIQGLSQQLPSVLASGAQIVTSIVGGIAQMLPSIAQSALEIVSSLLTMIVENLPQVISAGAQILQSIVEGIGASLPQIVAAAVEMLAEFLQTIVQNLPQILAAGFGLITSLIEGIGNALPGVITAAGEIASTIWDTITGIDWLDLGANIIRGLINGIGSMGGALWDAATKVAQSALDAIKSFFGIASPSRLMQLEIGPYIPQGLAIGIEKNAGYVTDAMDDLGLQSTARLRSAIAAGNPQPARADSRDPDLLTAIYAAAGQIVEAIQENGGDLYIGDDVIGRANARYQADRAILLGGGI